jgi:hypothetical protein
MICKQPSHRNDEHTTTIHETHFIACSTGWTQPKCNKSSRRLNFSRTFLDAQEEVTESFKASVYVLRFKTCDPLKTQNQQHMFQTKKSFNSYKTSL